MEMEMEPRPRPSGLVADWDLGETKGRSFMGWLSACLPACPGWAGWLVRQAVQAEGGRTATPSWRCSRATWGKGKGKARRPPSGLRTRQIRSQQAWHGHGGRKRKMASKQHQDPLGLFGIGTVRSRICCDSAARADNGEVACFPERNRTERNGLGLPQGKERKASNEPAGFALLYRSKKRRRRWNGNGGDPPRRRRRRRGRGAKEVRRQPPWQGNDELRPPPAGRPAAAAR